MAPNSDEKDDIYETITVHPYEWNVEDGYGDDGHVVIHAWCLDRDSKPYLLRFNDFPVFCYVELPYYTGNRYIRWERSRADKVINMLQRALGDDAPTSGTLTYMQKLYYYRGGKKNPMLLLKFDTIAAMDRCAKMLETPQYIEDLGMLAFKVWETNIPLVRKMLTLRNCGYSQWLEIQALKVDEDERLSTLEHEYICNWRTLTPIDPEITKSWHTYPTVLAFDIECYSDKHNAMPNKLFSKHVAYMISLIYQRLGSPETRKRYMILYGDCDDFEGTDIIRVKSEVEMCNKMAELVNQLDPDILTGYNIFGFDYDYLNSRITRRHKTWPEMGRLKGRKPILKSKSWRSDAYGQQDLNILHLDGRISIDMLPIIRRDYKFSKYDLDTVSREFLDRGKHPVKPKEMFEIYEKCMNASERVITFNEKHDLNLDSHRLDLSKAAELTHIEGASKLFHDYEQAKAEMTRVAKYCVEDSELVIDIIEKTNTWIGLIELSNIVGVSVMEIFTRGQQVRCMSQIYDLASKLGVVIDRRPFSDSTFKGGFVKEPVPGLWDYVACLDFKSLYPSIIQAFNICYTTLIPPELVNQIPDEECNIIEWTEDEDFTNPDEADDEEDESITGVKKDLGKKYRYKYIKAPTGILPQLVRNLVDSRNAVRGLIKSEKDPLIQIVLDKRQNALKISANSIFGFLGVPDGQLPLYEAAMSITAKGRELITYCNEYLKTKYGAQIIYNDSVTGDTPVLIRRSGQVSMVTIGSLTPDINLAGKLRMPLTDTEVWSDEGWTQIKQVIRHRTSKKLYRVLTHTGVVDVTEDHSLLAPDGTEVTPRALKIGQPLLHRDLPDISDTSSESVDAELYAIFFKTGQADCIFKSGYPDYRWSLIHTDHATLTNIANSFKTLTANIEKLSSGYKLSLTGPGLADLVLHYRKVFYQGSDKIVPNVILTNAHLREKFFRTLMGKSSTIDLQNKCMAASLYHLAALIGYKVSLNTRETGSTLYRLRFSKTGARKGSDLIKKIIPLDKCNDYVYDLETANHHFSAGIGRMVVHNTDSTMFKLPFVNSNKEILEWGHKLEKELSAQFPPPLYTEFEKAGRMFCIKKKKYAFWTADPKTEELKTSERLVLIDEAGVKIKPDKIWPDPLSRSVIDDRDKVQKCVSDLWKDVAVSNDRVKRTEHYKITDVASGQKYELVRSISPDFMVRGIILARRDNCMWQRQVYNQVLDNIIERFPMDNTLNIIIDEILALVSGRVPWDQLTIIRSLGANYKSDSYFMKIFGDELKLLGKLVAPGDRLEYLIVNSNDKDKAELLGHKMRLPETYLERLDSDNPERIDYNYYLEKVVKNCVEQLFQIGYKTELDALLETYKADDYNKVFQGVAALGYGEYLTELWIYYSGDVEAILKALMEQSRLKSKVQPLKSHYITRRKRLNTRIDKNPVKMMLKLVQRKSLYQADLINAVKAKAEAKRETNVVEAATTDTQAKTSADSLSKETDKTTEVKSNVIQLKFVPYRRKAQSQSP